jgi:predicted ATPase
MLKKLSVKNLGCFDEQTYSIEFSEETLIAGPNNSGKSMFIAGMNLLRSFIITGSLNWSTEFYNLVGFTPAVHAHDMNRRIEISATLLENSSEYTYEFYIEKGNKVDWYVNRVRRRRDPKDINLMRKIWSFRPNRSPVPYTARVQPTAGPLQPLNSNGSNVINFLLERWTARDKRWDVAESWLKKIDPDMSEMRTPIKGSEVSFETMFVNMPVNVSLQGSGFQSAAAIIAAVVFSPKGSTIIIEEPEVFLHPDSQEVMVDMINDAVNNQKKQLIFSTHSCNILLPFFSDIGRDAARRTGDHICADPHKFSMYVFKKISGKVSIEPYPLHEKTFRQFREDFRHIWG